MPVEVETTVESPNDGLQEYVATLRKKILFGLAIYPALSPSMLHVFLGTATAVSVWKPLLSDLLAEGLVVEEEHQLKSPHDRSQTYTILRLACNAYSPPTPQE